MVIGNPSENRFMEGEIRLSRPKQNCTSTMQNTIGRVSNTAALNTQAMALINRV